MDAVSSKVMAYVLLLTVSPCVLAASYMKQHSYAELLKASHHHPLPAYSFISSPIQPLQIQTVGAVNSSLKNGLFIDYRLTHHVAIEGGFLPKFISRMNNMADNSQKSFYQTHLLTNVYKLSQQYTSLTADSDLFAVGMAYRFD